MLSYLLEVPGISNKFDNICLTETNVIIFIGNARHIQQRNSLTKRGRFVVPWDIYHLQFLGPGYILSVNIELFCHN